MKKFNLINKTIDDKKLESTKRVLIDNGIEEDEVDTVLQAIGYTLLDIELFPDED